jgi:3-methyladenine DNA glycosylase AlkD
MPSIEEQVQSALAALRSRSTKANLDGMARYAIPSDHAYGVAMRDIKALGKTLGRNHALAVALWSTGVYEARMLASFVGDPEQLTSAQMDRWCRDFDNWAFCDAMSFNLFDRSPHAWDKVTEWSSRRREFEKRTAFALLWSLTVHVGKRNRALNSAAVEAAHRLAASEDVTARWVGRDALRELTSPAVTKRLRR